MEGTPFDTTGKKTFQSASKHSDKHVQLRDALQQPRYSNCAALYPSGAYQVVTVLAPRKMHAGR